MTLTIKHRNKNWVTQVKTVLHGYGYGYVWRSGEIDNTCLKSIKRRMLDHYYQTWYSEINNSSKLKSCTLFKHTLNREQYLDFVKEPY